MQIAPYISVHLPRRPPRHGKNAGHIYTIGCGMSLSTEASTASRSPVNRLGFTIHPDGQVQDLVASAFSLYYPDVVIPSLHALQYIVYSIKSGFVESTHDVDAWRHSGRGSRRVWTVVCNVYGVFVVAAPRSRTRQLGPGITARGRCADRLARASGNHGWGLATSATQIL